MNNRLHSSPKVLTGDVYANCSLIIALLASPFMSLGSIGYECIYYTGLAISLIFLTVFFVRIFYCYKKNRYTRSSFLPYYMRDCTLPYVTVLSALIVHPDGKNCSPALWFALSLFIVVSLIYLFVATRKS